MAKDIDIDVRGAISTLRREFKHLATSQFNLAVARAINHTIGKARTGAARDIRTQYKVKAAGLKKTMVISKANRSNQTAMIRVSASPLPLIAFGARQTRKGVSVNITGKRKIIKGAFIAMGRRGGTGSNAGVSELGTSGHKGVFARGKYNGTEFDFRKKRINKKGPDLPIGELNTASPYSMMINQQVQSATADMINSSFPARLLHELKRM